MVLICVLTSPTLTLSVFSKDEVETIRKVRLYDIILATTNISRFDIQEKVFFHTADDPCPQPLQLNASLMESCRFLSGHDYFQVGYRTVIFLYMFSC